MRLCTMSAICFHRDQYRRQKRVHLKVRGRAITKLKPNTALTGRIVKAENLLTIPATRVS